MNKNYTINKMLNDISHNPIVTINSSFKLKTGFKLEQIKIAYQTYGSLNKNKSNAILLCHALTGDQYASGIHPINKKPGWWNELIGPNKVFDTNRYFMICTNVLGGCMGTTGPLDLNPETGNPYGISFPEISISDMVDVQKILVDKLGIEQLFCVIGGSMGGMQVLDWAARYPNKVFSAAPIATSYRHTAQNIAFHEVGRQAIRNDPDWNKGEYIIHNTRPLLGLGAARMVAHITYMSEGAFAAKFGRERRDSALSNMFKSSFEVESYLQHQGSSFVDRFDANSYLYITRAMDTFDLSESYINGLTEAFHNTPCRWLVVSFTSDWLFPTSESKKIIRALNANAADVSFVEISSESGHDSFLLNVPRFHSVLKGFLDGAARHKNFG